MKKVILCTVGSLFLCGGLVTGFWGADLAGSGAAVAASCSDLPGVEACILIKKNGKVDIVAGKDKKLRKPKEPNKPEEPADSVKEPKDQPKSKLPTTIKDSEEYEKYGDTFKPYEITIYAGNTCGNINGVWYCW